ncbi:MetQ/NlpA family ABC transporter substrate-binding protein [uncultured Helicobacter sp.]|uniref:MetQ/NlpA family ABC transporter substrate-binding protein n=1 Tax=uncultured Helicobacter sp. TaxID=175537 RepID=UPI0025DF3386|nr:MetQ/NlpA family ABC transporter substrate-binding protein [uncultured Helicobacter sp.]
MRKIVSLAFVVALSMGFVACGDEKAQSSKDEVSKSAPLRVGATPVPAAEILDFIKPQLQAKGVEIQIQNFTDYVVPNTSLAEGSSDANLYQHKPFMDKTNEEKGYKLTAIAPVYVVPLGFYSQKVKSVDEIPQGATIAIPGDASNMARAFILLHDNGVIKIKDPSNLNTTELDVIENPKKIVFKPMEAASLPLVLDSVDGAVINANYALQAKMSLKSAIFHENDKSAYVNVLVAREDNKDDERIAKLKEVLLSKETREFILSKYKGEIIPVSAAE